jgi:hypothetical protein
MLSLFRQTSVTQEAAAGIGSMPAFRGVFFSVRVCHTGRINHGAGHAWPS